MSAQACHHGPTARGKLRSPRSAQTQPSALHPDILFLGHTPQGIIRVELLRRAPQPGAGNERQVCHER